MNSFTETSVLRLDLQISKDGPLSEEEAKEIKNELIQFFNDRRLNAGGRIDYINSKSHHRSNFTRHHNLDTSA